MTKVRFISTPKAITGKALTIAVGIALATIIHSCSDDRVSDRELTKEYQITEFLTKDVIGKTVFPLVWFDTTSRATQYGIATGAGPNVTINPLDYWVEVIRTGRNIAIRDTCVPDEFTQGGDCIETLLDNGARADAEIGQLQDTIFVRYHIVERSDSTVYIKEVRFLETQLALMARLDNFQAAYRGWRLYGVGRQRHGFGFAATQNFPRIDSIVVESRARQEIRFAAYPDRQATYTWTGRLMVLYDGEPLTVTAYTRPRFNNPPITDAYVHYSVNGQMTHEWMGGDISNDPERQIYSWDISESSKSASGTFSQIVVELFQERSLRDSNPQAFNNLLWAITYKIE